MQESAAHGGLEGAIQRLDRAVAQLEVQTAGALRKASSEGVGAFDQDRANLAAELDAARGRERELEQAGAEAARALGRAIVEIRAAIGESAADAVLGGED